MIANLAQLLENVGDIHKRGRGRLTIFIICTNLQQIGSNLSTPIQERHQLRITYSCFLSKFAKQRANLNHIRPSRVAATPSDPVVARAHVKQHNNVRMRGFYFRLFF